MTPSFEDPARTSFMETHDDPELMDSTLKPELAPDTSWLTMEPVNRPLLRPRWTVEGRITGAGRRDPFDQPTFRTRRRAERYARRHSCEHITYTVRPVSRCRCGGENNRESWRHTGGYASGHRRVTELPQVPSGPAPGARPTD